MTLLFNLLLLAYLIGIFAYLIHKTNKNHIVKKQLLSAKEAYKSLSIDHAKLLRKKDELQRKLDNQVLNNYAEKSSNKVFYDPNSDSIVTEQDLTEIGTL